MPRQDVHITGITPRQAQILREKVAAFRKEARYGLGALRSLASGAWNLGRRLVGRGPKPAVSRTAGTAAVQPKYVRPTYTSPTAVAHPEAAAPHAVNTASAHSEVLLPRAVNTASTHPEVLLPRAVNTASTLPGTAARAAPAVPTVTPIPIPMAAPVSAAPSAAAAATAAAPSTGGFLARAGVTGLGLAGLGLAGHHLGVPGLNRDPTRGMSPEQAYRYHLGEYNQHASPVIRELEQAIQKGDFAKANELQAKLQSGDFGGAWGANAFGRFLAPWFYSGTGNAAYHRQNALDAAQKLQGEYNDAMRGHIGTPEQLREQIGYLTAKLQGGGLMPRERQLVEMQLKQMRNRLAGNLPRESDEAMKIRQRMRNAGMPFEPFQGMGGPGGVYQGSGMPAGPTTIPNPATTYLNSNASPGMLNVNPYGINNVENWALGNSDTLNPNDFRARPGI